MVLRMGDHDPAGGLDTGEGFRVSADELGLELDLVPDLIS